jgi:hypothetical protein
MKLRNVIRKQGGGGTAYGVQHIPYAIGNDLRKLTLGGQQRPTKIRPQNPRGVPFGKNPPSAPLFQRGKRGDSAREGRAYNANFICMEGVA